MKKIIIPLVILLGIVAAIVLVLVWWKSVVGPPSLDPTQSSLLITKGMSASQVGIKLSKEGFVKSATAFKIYTQMTGKSKNIQAGEYLLPKNFNLYRLVDELLKGPTQIWVTIPEGFRREQVAIRFADSLVKEGIERESFIKEFLALTEGKEGFLFPDTYLIAKDITPAKIVFAMEATYTKVTSELKEDIENSSLTENQIITIASMIERETKTKEERPKVSGVIYNRLENDWPLQIDAAVQFAVSSSKIKSQYSNLDEIKFWPDLTRDDLEINSPFNTYKYSGLPPAPIASPGINSISAAVNPEKNDYFFYLHDADGSIHFAKTLEEHNTNVREYLGK